MNNRNFPLYVKRKEKKKKRHMYYNSPIRKLLFQMSNFRFAALCYSYRIQRDRKISLYVLRSTCRLSSTRSWWIATTQRQKTTQRQLTSAQHVSVYVVKRRIAKSPEWLQRHIRMQRRCVCQWIKLIIF